MSARDTMTNTLKSLVAVCSALSLSGCLCLMPMSTMNSDRQGDMSRSAQDGGARQSNGTAAERR